MVWKASTTVGFGVKDDWVVAWFCQKGNTGDYAANVIKRCKKDGYNTCVNEDQLKLHNEKRVEHKDNTLLELDTDAAKKIQELLNAKSDEDMAKTPFVLAESSARGDEKWAKCVENIFEATDKTDPETKKATETWYAGNANYDFDTGAPNTAALADDALKKKAHEFMRMVWKATTKVAFGIKDKVVVAWYCEEAASVIDSNLAKTNIPGNCIDADNAGANKCYNDKALAAHNAKRKTHLSVDLIQDLALAGIIQTAMNDAAFAGEYTNDACTVNIYEEKDAAEVAKLPTNDKATDEWYK